MRLSDLCLAYRMYKKPIGFAYRGKNRKLRRVTQSQLLDIKKDLEREELNMLWLRHPYLTIEEEKGYMSALKSTGDKFMEFKEKRISERSMQFVKPVTITDRLKCLMVADKWE